LWFQWPRVRTPPPTPAFPANSTAQQPLARRDCIRLCKQPAAFMVPTGSHAFLTFRPQCCEPLAGVSTSSTHRPLLNPMLCLVGAAQRVRPFYSDRRAVPCSRKGAVPRGACRQACHAGGHAGRATQSRTVREFQSPSAAKTGGVARTTACSTSTRRCKVEHAARLAMPAVTPAEPHNPERYGSRTPSAAKTGGVARTTARST